MLPEAENHEMHRIHSAPMVQTIDHTFENSILSIRLVEEYSIEELLDELESCCKLYAQNASIGVVIDATRSQSSRSLEEIRRYMPRIARLKDSVVGFSVVVASDFLFGLTSQTSAYAEISGIEVRPFRNYDEAVLWIQEKMS